jgi:hypothetical protein
MIAYLLLRIAARENRLKIPPIRFADIVANCIFTRKPIVRIDKRPETNPSRAQPKYSHLQMKFNFAWTFPGQPCACAGMYGAPIEPVCCAGKAFARGGAETRSAP